jgi:type II secretory ATPase GspE/PulE/Tfp pilus assembly ATPase PilB-like protein
VLSQVNVLGEDVRDVVFYKPAGCESCRYTGFRGRTALHEVVKINEPLRRRIVAGASANELKREAMRAGMRPIRWDGWEKVKRGETTIEEVLRVTIEDDMTPDELAEVLREAQLSRDAD